MSSADWVVFMPGGGRSRARMKNKQRLLSGIFRLTVAAERWLLGGGTIVLAAMPLGPAVASVT